MDQPMDQELIRKIANRASDLISPAEVGRALGIPTQIIIQCLFIAIGEGLIRESELFFILAKKYEGLSETFSSDEMESVAKKHWENVIKAKIFPANSDPDEIKLFRSYRKRKAYLGDMFLYLSELERTLHQRVESILKKKFGVEERQWWKKGVKDTVRVDCARAREFDDESVDHAYHFTNFIHLKKIIQHQQKLFVPRLPQSVAENLEQFFDDMTRLNRIRNQVMHPVREKEPTEEDFRFVRELHRNLVAGCWR